jgi:hypothetical protein
MYANSSESDIFLEIYESSPELFGPKKNKRSLPHIKADYVWPYVFLPSAGISYSIQIAMILLHFNSLDRFLQTAGDFLRSTNHTNAFNFLHVNWIQLHMLQRDLRFSSL